MFAVRCTYEFKQGAKKGSLCNTPCRGDFCRTHKPKNVERRKEYYREQQVGKNGIEFSRVKEQIEKGIILDKQNYISRCRSYHHEIVFIEKNMIGIKLFLGSITEEEIFKKYHRAYNSVLYDKAEKYAEERIEDDLTCINIKEDIYRKHNKQFYINAEDYIKYCDKRDIEFENYVKKCRESDAKDLSTLTETQKEARLKSWREEHKKMYIENYITVYDNGKRLYIPYKGIKTRAKQTFEKFKKMRDENINKRNELIDIIKLIETVQNKEFDREIEDEDIVTINIDELD
jgi:hypothetical protein